MLEVFVQKSIHDGIRADRAHRREVAAREEHQHHFCVLLVVLEGFKYIDDNVKDIERGPRCEEDDTDSDEHPVSFLPSLHLTSSSVR